MSLNGIYTIRNFEKWPSWQCVYEWEEDFSSELAVNLINVNQRRYNLLSLYRKIYRATKVLPIKPKQITGRGDLKLVFLMDFYQIINFSCSNVLPVIIDFWGQYLKDFNKLFKHFELIFVTSLEVKEILQKQQNTIRIEYIPLPISRRWKKPLNHNKSIDIIQIGRKNSLLHDYALTLTTEFPDIEYVYQKNIDGQLYYFSTKRGLLGNFHKRDDFMKLLYDSKISLVSSTGADKSRDTGGINPIPARFAESMVNYCYLVGRYPDNLDFNYWRIRDYCPSIGSYEEFKYHVLNSLDEPFNRTKEYDEFLENFYADKVAHNISEVLKKER